MATPWETPELHTNDPVVALIPLSTVRPANRNARTHSPKQIGQIADSIKAFGWTNPVLVGDDGTIVAATVG